VTCLLYPVVLLMNNGQSCSINWVRSRVVSRDSVVRGSVSLANDGRKRSGNNARRVGPSFQAHQRQLRLSLDEQVVCETNGEAVRELGQMLTIQRNLKKKSTLAEPQTDIFAPPLEYLATARRAYIRRLILFYWTSKMEFPTFFCSTLRFDISSHIEN